MWSGFRIAIGRIHAHGCALVLFDSELLKERLLPGQRAAVERLAEKLVPHSSGKPFRRTSSFEPFLANSLLPLSAPTVAALQSGHEDEENELKILDLTTGLMCSTFDMGPLTNLTRDDLHSGWGGAGLLGGLDRKTRLWHLRPARQSGRIPRPLPQGNVVARIFAGRPDPRLRGRRPLHTALEPWKPARKQRVLRGHDALVTSVAFAPDGRTLASASFDLKAPVALWDVATGTLQSILQGHTAKGTLCIVRPGWSHSRLGQR